MVRANWKGPFFNKNDLKNLQKSKKNHAKITVSRTTTILPKFIDKTVAIYNGKKFNEITVIEEMVGYKFGEFSSTRKKFSFKKKKLKK